MLTPRCTLLQHQTGRLPRTPKIPCLQQRRVTHKCHSNKQYVPSDGFGGLSPERKAADQLRTLFTYIAARIVLAQLEGSGRGALGAYNSEGYKALADSLQNVPLKDGDQWLAQLMRANNSIALRVMEVREAYSQQDFEWDQLQKLAINDTKAANTKLMRSFATASLLKSLAEQSGSVDTEEVSEASDATTSAPPTAGGNSEPRDSSTSDGKEPDAQGPATPPAAGL